MNMIKQITIISIIILIFSSCYIDNNETGDGTERTTLSFDLPIPEDVSKDLSGYYFEIYLYPAAGEEIFKVFDLNTYDPYNGGGGGTFPVVLTDLPEGLYTDLNIRFYYAGDLRYLDNSVYEFTLTKGQNTVVNVVIGEFF